MNNISIISHIKNDIEFVPQFWKHIHSYNPKEIIILDTGSIDGTYELLTGLPKQDGIQYIIEKFPYYTGMVPVFNKLVSMATSEWVIKLDVDELLRKKTINEIVYIIEKGIYNCISIPTIHHFINSDLFFNCIRDYPDYHQRIFKKEVFNINSSTYSKNHGCIIWNDNLKVETLGFDHALYHYSFLRSFEKIQKRSIINYYIDIEKVEDAEALKNVELNIKEHIELFKTENRQVVPAWQVVPILLKFNDLEEYYISQFTCWGKRNFFAMPEDLILHTIENNWNNAKKKLSIL